MGLLDSGSKEVTVLSTTTVQDPVYVLWVPVQFVVLVVEDSNNMGKGKRRIVAKNGATAKAASTVTTSVVAQNNEESNRITNYFSTSKRKVGQQQKQTDAEQQDEQQKNAQTNPVVVIQNNGCCGAITTSRVQPVIPSADTAKPSQQSQLSPCEQAESDDCNVPPPSQPISAHKIQLDGEHSPSTAISKLAISSSNGVVSNGATPKKPLTRPTTRRKLVVTQTNAQASIDNRELTEFYPVRRSVRRTGSKLKGEMLKYVEETILTGKEEGMRVEHIRDKGRGVVATRKFKKGEFVVEYSGELIDLVEAKRRELQYSANQNMGCFMYYFCHNDQKWCIDATSESGRFGRLVNHSRCGNLYTKSFAINHVPHLILVAKRDIEIGEELLYDYGDRSKSSLEHYPWLAT